MGSHRVGQDWATFIFTADGQHIGAFASASVLPINIQEWFPLRLTALISLQSKGLSRVFSNIIVRKPHFFNKQTYFWPHFYISVRGSSNFPHMYVSICLPVFKLKKTLPPRFSSNAFEKHASFILKKAPDSGRNLPNVGLVPAKVVKHDFSQTYRAAQDCPQSNNITPNTSAYASFQVPASPLCSSRQECNEAAGWLLE